MTHVTCSGCQLRFTHSAAATITRCPFCGGGLELVPARRTIGYQLVEPVVSLNDLPVVPPSSEPTRLPTERPPAP